MSKKISKKNVKVAVKTRTKKTKTSTKTSKSPRIVLKNISALQTILAEYAEYAGYKDVLTIGDDEIDNLPQTFIPNDEDNAEIPISDLLYEKSKRAYHFLDNRKRKNKLWRIMYDFTTYGPLPSSTTKPCWWCRHSFQTSPIGCPMKYNPHKSSGVEKERYDQKMRNIGLGSCDDKNDFFETIGIFCSFPCCKAYILDQRGSLKYNESSTLLSLLFLKLYGKAPEFPHAPSWKLLKDYGGHLSIAEFRETFGRLEYSTSINVRRPYMYCTSEYIKEKKIKLYKNTNSF
ncbi:MAG TPA: hypothetical protein PKD85_01460 [Saprospiraceae bacterium]|nr:hypothetical protein [Saprospiraceae bacterium]